MPPSEKNSFLRDFAVLTIFRRGDPTSYPEQFPILGELVRGANQRSGHAVTFPPSGGAAAGIDCRSTGPRGTAGAARVVVANACGSLFRSGGRPCSSAHKGEPAHAVDSGGGKTKIRRCLVSRKNQQLGELQ